MRISNWPARCSRHARAPLNRFSTGIEGGGEGKRGQYKTLVLLFPDTEGHHILLAHDFMIPLRVVSFLSQIYDIFYLFVPRLFLK